MPDGIQVDNAGNVYAACGDGVHVRIPGAPLLCICADLSLLGMEPGRHAHREVLPWCRVRQYGLRQKGRADNTGGNSNIPGTDRSGWGRARLRLNALMLVSSLLGSLACACPPYLHLSEAIDGQSVGCSYGSLPDARCSVNHEYPLQVQTTCVSLIQSAG